MSNAAMNIHKVVVWKYVYRGVDLLDDMMIRSVFMFFRSCQTVSQSGCPV